MFRMSDSDARLACKIGASSDTSRQARAGDLSSQGISRDPHQGVRRLALATSHVCQHLTCISVQLRHARAQGCRRWLSCSSNTPSMAVTAVQGPRKREPERLKLIHILFHLGTSQKESVDPCQ